MNSFSRAAVLLLLVSTSALAESPPSWLPYQDLFSFVDRDSEYEDYGWADGFRTGDPKGNGDRFEVRGHHWSGRMYPPKPEPWKDEDWKNFKLPAVLDAMVSRLKSQGYQLDYLRPDQNWASLHKGTGNGARYVWIDDNHITIVEVVPNPLTVTLKPPAETPETFGDQDDFPYIAPLPGSQFGVTDHREGTPFTYPLPDRDRPGRFEREDVALGYLNKRYHSPPHVSKIEFAQAYAAALAQAGWDVTNPEEKAGTVGGRYTKNGRDLWAYLSYLGDTWEVRVADVGQQIKSQAKACTVEVYGVNFDFDKATLRPDSDAVLNQVLSLFKDDPKLSAEIGGHTDNVGKADYNLKLSNERAESVKTWLIAHGVSASRLSARGYGDKVPLVKNDSDDNRAKNRRVELKKQACKS